MAYDDLVQSLGAAAYYKGNDASGLLSNVLWPATASNVLRATFPGGDTTAGTVPAADTGQSFIQVSGAGTPGWRVLGGSVIDTSVANESMLLVNLGQSDGYFSVVLTTVPTQGDGGLVVRSDATGLNIIHLNWEGSLYRLLRRVAGTYTSLGTIAVTPAVGDVLSITAVGSSITAAVNGTTLTVTETAGQTNGYYGVRASNANQTKNITFDNLAVGTAGAKLNTTAGLTYRQTRVLPTRGDLDQSAVSMSAAGDAQLPRAAVGNLTGAHTVALWVSFALATNPGTGQVIVGCANTSSSFSGITVHLENSMTQITFSIKSASAQLAAFGVVPGGTFAANGTGQYFVCLSFSNGWSNGSVMTGYVNSPTNPLTLVSGSTTLTATVTPTTNPFHIGTIEDAFWQKLTGRVSNVALWNRALSATEVTQLHRAGYLEGVST